MGTDASQSLHKTAQLSTEDVLRCLNNSLLLEVNASSAWIHLNESLKQEGKRVCQVRLTGPAETIFRIQQPRKFLNLWDFQVEIKDSKPRHNRGYPMFISKWRSANPPFAFSLGHIVTFIIRQRRPFTNSFCFNVSFASLQYQPQMTISNLSETSGRTAS